MQSVVALLTQPKGKEKLLAATKPGPAGRTSSLGTPAR
jgi:hypothetical protein